MTEMTYRPGVMTSFVAGLMNWYLFSNLEIKTIVKNKKLNRRLYKAYYLFADRHTLETLNNYIFYFLE